MKTRRLYHSLPSSLLLLNCIFLMSSCSSPPRSIQISEFEVPGPLFEKTKSQLLKDSSIDIQYILGHEHYRFVATSLENSVTAKSLRDRQIVRNGPIDKNLYTDFFQKASNFISHSKSSESSGEKSDSHCRSPFTVTVNIEKETHTTKGCRSTDNGTLSKLVNDGEFLLYSQN